MLNGAAVMDAAILVIGRIKKTRIYGNVKEKHFFCSC